MRLLMWDVDLTLLHAGGVARESWAEAFGAMTGLAPRVLPTFAGRTDLDTAAEIFRVHGLPEPDFEEFFDRYAAAFAARRDLVARHGRVLPGAAEVLAALAERPDITQTVVTGNIRPVAEVKLDALGLSGTLDLDVGGYGTDDGDRATLVRRGRQRAEAKYGTFADLWVIGDTRHDVAAALACGARAVGVASGSAGADELASAGADLVLESLADVGAVVRALTGSRCVNESSSPG
ncbi:haloacid dehalogenase-like hydrolase [Rugosimonospora acidiphila]|uniref:Haloacid dehalogenase-like hydrolase n=1 Tax=Rugosimonospora acidiphila TaxID=556531 RepID=A0ABP9RYQ3_9ACTN